MYYHRSDWPIKLYRSDIMDLIASLTPVQGRRGNAAAASVWRVDSVKDTCMHDVTLYFCTAVASACLIYSREP